MTRTGGPLIEWFCEIETNVEAGWQLQKGEFRLAIRVNPELIEAVSAADVLLEVLFEFSYFDEAIGTEGEPVMPKRRSFNKFDPAKDKKGEPAFIHAYPVNAYTR